MPTAKKGVLVECDPSIKAIVLKIDRERNNAIVIEDLDDEHLLVSEDQVELLKNVLNDTLKENTQVEMDDSGSD